MQSSAVFSHAPQRQHSHCSYCGHPFPPGAGWPRTCPGCAEVTWRNPLPVAMVLVPVVETGAGQGLVVIERDIEPARGLLTLPGGFIETGETWQQAAVRELAEETGLAAQVDDVALYDVHSTPGTVNIFALLPPRPAAELPPSSPTDETTGYQVITAPQELAFSTATLVVHRYFASA